MEFARLHLTRYKVKKYIGVYFAYDHYAYFALTYVLTYLGLVVFEGLTALRAKKYIGVYIAMTCTLMTCTLL
jgi:hypothetical protein